VVRAPSLIPKREPPAATSPWPAPRVGRAPYPSPAQSPSPRASPVRVAVHHGRGVLRPASVRLQSDDRGEHEGHVGGHVRRPIAGLERPGPDEPTVRHHFEVAPSVRELLAFGRLHHRVELAAGLQVDFAVDRLPRGRGEPLHEVLGRGPRLPHEFRPYVDDALERQVQFRVHSDSFSSVRKLSNWSRRRSY
jgi:hypothetical protein